MSTSGLGRECLRQIQYDYLAVAKDEGRDFEPKTLRIFEAGHRGEDVVAAWLRSAGFDLELQTHVSTFRVYGKTCNALSVATPARALARMACKVPQSSPVPSSPSRMQWQPLSSYLAG